MKTDFAAQFVQRELRAARDLKARLCEDEQLAAHIIAAADLVARAFGNGNKLMIAGNGGSAADAQHLAAEFVERCQLQRPGFACLALTTDTSVLTAVSNDRGFEAAFARQIEALGKAGDVFLAISTSGNSGNIVHAARVCRDRRINVVGLCGQTGGVLSGLCGVCIRVPSTNTQRLQEAHILVGHILCSLVEELLYGERAGQP